MNDTLKTALETLAIARATKLCDAAMATLAAGRRTFVKGKPVMVPWSAEKRAELKWLQTDAFKAADMKSQADVSGALPAGTDEIAFVEAMGIYCAAGQAEVERRFA